MGMTAGTKPTSYSSTLTGLSQLLYQNRISNGVIPSESAITTTIGTTTYTESTANQQARVFNAKLQAYTDAESIISHITSSAVVNNISSIVQQTVLTPTTPVPIPNDGGAAILTAMTSNMSTNALTGTIS